MEDFAHAMADFVRDHQAWAAPIVLLLAFGESLAFKSLLIPAWGALVAIGALIGVSGISFWPVWLAEYFHRTIFRTPARLRAARRRDFRDAVLALSDRQFRIRTGLVGGTIAVWRRHRANRRM